MMARLAFDMKLMRPGCVLLQAAYGCVTESGHNPANLFDSDLWLLGPTLDLKAYTITEKELRAVARRLNGRVR